MPSKHLGTDRLADLLRLDPRAGCRGRPESGLDGREVVREAGLVLRQIRCLARPATAMDVNADELFQQRGPAVLEVAVEVVFDQRPEAHAPRILEAIGNVVDPVLPELRFGHGPHPPP